MDEDDHRNRDVSIPRSERPGQVQQLQVRHWPSVDEEGGHQLVPDGRHPWAGDEKVPDVLKDPRTGQAMGPLLHTEAGQVAPQGENVVKHLEGHVRLLSGHLRPPQAAPHHWPGQLRELGLHLWRWGGSP